MTDPASFKIMMKASICFINMYFFFFLVDYKCVFAEDRTEAIHLSSSDMFVQYNNSQSEIQTNSTNENVILFYTTVLYNKLTVGHSIASYI